MSNQVIPIELEQALLSLVSGDILQVPPAFNVESDLFVAGLDSMAIMQMLLLIEERFGITVPVESVSRNNFSTVRAVAALLVQRGWHALDSPVPIPAVNPKPDPVTNAVAQTASMTAAFRRLPLRDCDFFVVAFDQMIRDSGGNGHTAHSFLELEACPDVVALQRVIASLPEKYPLLNARLTREWFLALPSWEPAERVKPIEFRLWSQEGSPGKLHAQGACSFSELQKLLEDFTNSPLRRDADGWLNARFDLVEKCDGTFVFVFSWSHIIMDGVGAEHFLMEIERQVSGGREAVSPYDFDEEETRRGWNERWKSARPMVKTFEALMKKPFGCLGPRELAAGRTHFETFTLTEAQTLEVARRSAAISGPLVNMPFHLACAMRAHFRVFQQRGKTPESLITNVPVQVRRKGARGPMFQNHLTMFFGALDPEQMGSLDTAGRALQEQHARFLKEKQGDAFRDLMWLMRPMPPGLHMKFIRWQMKGTFCSFYHSHTGMFAPELVTFFGARITNAYHVPGISGPPGTGLFGNERNGCLVLTFCWREGALTRAERQLFMDQVYDDIGAGAAPLVS